MSQGLFSSFPTRLLLALGISILLHMILLWFPFNHSLTAQRPAKVLEVRLAHSHRLANTVISSTPTQATLRSTHERSGQASKDDPSVSAQRKNNDASTTVLAAQDTIAVTDNIDQGQSLPSASLTAVANDASSPGTPIRHARIEFIVVTSLPVGHEQRLLQEYARDTEDRYQLKIRTFTDPPAATLDSVDAWDIQIDGNIGHRGLVTREYRSLPSLSSTLMSLQQTEALSTPESHAARMPDGILDRFSVMYQFMLIEHTRMPDRLSLTDGLHVMPHTYTYEGPELIDLPLHAQTMTEHHRLSSVDSRIAAEVWVAPTMQRLPVKVRYTDTNGTVTELIASSIQYTND